MSAVNWRMPNRCPESWRIGWSLWGKRFTCLVSEVFRNNEETDCFFFILEASVGGRGTLWEEQRSLERLSERTDCSKWSDCSAPFPHNNLRDHPPIHVELDGTGFIQLRCWIGEEFLIRVKWNLSWSSPLSRQGSGKRYHLHVWEKKNDWTEVACPRSHAWKKKLWKIPAVETLHSLGSKSSGVHQDTNWNKLGTLASRSVLS